MSDNSLPMLAVALAMATMTGYAWGIREGKREAWRHWEKCDKCGGPKPHGAS